MSGAPNTPIIRKRTPASKCRYLEGRIDELIDQADKLSGRKFASAALTLLFSLSEVLSEFTPILEAEEARRDA